MEVTQDITKSKQGANASIQLAATIAIVGNALLAALKVVVGFISGSGALLGDGIDSIGDVLIGAMTLVVAKIISKPADAEHPWGHGRAETVATAALAFVIFFMGAQLALNSIQNLISGEQQLTSSTLAIVVTIISIVGKMLLAYSQQMLGKRAGSAMILANAKNMAADVLISVSVLVGLVVSAYTGSSIADTIMAILIGAWIMKTAIGIFLEANLELMDGSSDLESYQIIFDAVSAVKGASNPHRARMRRIGGYWDISFDIDVDPQCTVLEGHDIAVQVENEIRARLDGIHDIMIHVEPQGSDDSGEMFGVSEEMAGLP